MQNKKFDEAFGDLCTQHEYVKNKIVNENELSDTILELKKIKQKISELTTNNPERIGKKNNMMIMLCEHIAYCLLKENQPMEGIKVIEELETIQDVVKEKNTKALTFKARCYMMLNNLPKAFDNFSLVHSVADDDKTKKDIESILKLLKNDISKPKKVEKVRDIGDDLSEQIKEINNYLKFVDKTVELESTVDNDTKELNAEYYDKKIDENGNTKKDFATYTRTIEINVLKSPTAILSEFLTKYSNETPAFKLEGTVKQRGNKNVFKVDCCCLGHIEGGTDITMKKAKENAAEKMIKYLQDNNKLKLIGM